MDGRVVRYGYGRSADSGAPSPSSSYYAMSAVQCASTGKEFQGTRARTAHRGCMTSLWSVLVIVVFIHDPAWSEFSSECNLVTSGLTSAAQK